MDSSAVSAILDETMGAPRRPKATVVPPDLQESVDAFLAYLSLERGLAKLTVVAYEDDLARFAAHCARLGKERWTARPIWSAAGCGAMISLNSPADRSCAGPCLAL
ncbi:MAG: hypothetical protein EBR62_09570 [Verrucomicrobia bacterium]|nr:hypothetical protein [Verrucomicrobiota bacterium]